MKTYQVTVFNNRTEWMFEGKLHRENGPAIEYVDGAQSWLIEGKLHRSDGPAFISAAGHKVWYNMGRMVKIQYPDGIWVHFTEPVKEYSIEELEEKLGHKIKIVKK